MQNIILGIIVVISIVIIFLYREGIVEFIKDLFIVCIISGIFAVVIGSIIFISLAPYEFDMFLILCVVGITLGIIKKSINRNHK